MSAINTPSQEAQKTASHKKPKTVLPIENREFVYSRAGRSVRLLAEFEEFPERIKNMGIRGTFLFFGSARAMRRGEFDAAIGALSEKASNALTSEEDKRVANARLSALQRRAWMCDVFETTRELARLLSEWALSAEGVRIGRSVYTHFPSGDGAQPLIVCTGGGPGFMEAGNIGAAEVPGAVSMGVAITLPFESDVNDFVSPGMAFRSEYFFVRKFWETYCAKAMIVAPGGMGTCDEMFEVLTLMQCGQMKKIPVVLLGKKFWSDVINFHALADYGVISIEEFDALCVTDSAAEAFEFICCALTAEANSSPKENPSPALTPRKKGNA